LPPPRRSAQRLIDISAQIADYGQSPPRPNRSERKAGNTKKHIDQHDDPGDEVETGPEEQLHSETYAEGQDEDEDEEEDDDDEDEDENDEDEDEGSDLSEDFDSAQFMHDCLPETVSAKS
jgi:hypothetical protein